MYIYGIFGKKQSQIVNFLKCLFYFPGGGVFISWLYQNLLLLYCSIGLLMVLIKILIEYISIKFNEYIESLEISFAIEIS